MSVEDCSLVVGEMFGHEHVCVAYRMNGSAVVLFLSTVEKATKLVVNGIHIAGTHYSVLFMCTCANFTCRETELCKILETCNSDDFNW